MQKQFDAVQEANVKKNVRLSINYVSEMEINCVQVPPSLNELVGYAREVNKKKLHNKADLKCGLRLPSVY